MSDPKILIIGAGPTGLGAAWQLAQNQYSNWQLVDAGDTPGGLAASFVDKNGFTWDIGGHVLLSHYELFDQLFTELVGKETVEHERRAWIYMRHRLLPFPFQQNIGFLPWLEGLRCVAGVIGARLFSSGKNAEANFEEWILHRLGRGIADSFMLPYNRKVWGFDASEIETSWVPERVASVHSWPLLKSFLLRQSTHGWGRTPSFRYPLKGGMGRLWQALWERLPPERLALRKRVTQIHTREHLVEFSDGTRASYDYLLSSMPLDQLLKSLADQPSLAAQAAPFKHTSTHLVGVAVRGAPADEIADKSWFYVPEPQLPFYRVTVLSNYSPYNVPQAGMWSMMCEIGESILNPVDYNVPDRTIDGLYEAGLLSGDAEVLNVWHKRLEYGYPTPFVGLTSLLETLDPQLRRLGIWSRGRFGAWKYGLANQDHAFMQGVDAVNHWFKGTPETTYRTITTG